MKYCMFIIIMLTFFVSGFSSEQKQRVWTDLKGNRITASYVGLKNGNVLLRSEDGRALTVNRDLLSDDDWLFLAGKNPDFLNISVGVGSVSRAQRPKISEQGHITHLPKFDPLHFRLDSNNMLLIILGSEQWSMPLTDDFWDICEHLEPFKSGEIHFTSGAMWKTDIQSYGIGGRRMDSPRVLLHIRLKEKGEAEKMWWRGKENKQVATILFDDRALNDLRKMPKLSLKAQQKLHAHPRIKSLSRKVSLGNISSRYDKMEAATFYTNNRDCSLYLEDGSKVTLFMYIGESKGVPKLKFKLLYTADDWLFIDKAILVSDDDRRVVIDLSKKRDSKILSDASIAEWADVEIDPTTILPFANANKITCRIDGQFRRDFVFSTNQLMALREIIAMYVKLSDMK